VDATQSLLAIRIKSEDAGALLEPLGERRDAEARGIVGRRQSARGVAVIFAVC